VPGWAALIALADQGRAQAGRSALGTTTVLSTLYANPGDFHDIVTGTCTSTGFSAGQGYDLVTGLGTPQGPLVVSSLIGVAPTTAPASPNGLSATPADGQVSLLWNAMSGATSWNVYRSINGGAFALAATVGGTGFVDQGLTDGVNYSYELTAVNSIGESAPSTAVSTTPQVPPAAPVSLSAAGSSGSFAVNLQWAASSGASSYNVLRTSTSGGGYAVIASGILTTTSTDSTVFAGQTYYYVVQAVNAAGAISANSPQASALVIPSIPVPLSATPGNSQATLNWSPSTGATSYEILMSTTNGSGYVIVASNITATSFTITGLTNGTTYYFVIEAVNSTGASPQSSQLSATPTKHGK
jgi:cellulose 1,4-beta-cellobiosidase